MKIQRIPLKIPLDCYGLELDLAEAACQACPHQAGCREMMGDRFETVTLDRAAIDLHPAAHAPALDLDQAARGDLEAEYQRCARLIFRRPLSPLYHVSGAAAAIAASAKALRTTPKLFMLAVMLAYRDTGRVFYPAMLVSGGAQARARGLLARCVNLYGTAELATLGRVGDDDLPGRDLAARLWRSEVEAGAWVLGFKLRSQGKAAEALYQAMELRLDPSWLAVEPSYRPILEDSSGHGSVTPEVRDHRASVALVRGQLARHPARARQVLRLRNKEAARAISHVLNNHGYTTADFTTTRPITDMIKLWTGLALAIEHLRCLRFYLSRNERQLGPPAGQAKVIVERDGGCLGA